MNVIHGTLEGASFQTNGVKVKTKVKGQVTKAVAGVRPEDCSVTDPKKGTISGQIYTTELIGDHTLVTVNWGDDQIVVKAHKDFDGKQGGRCWRRAAAGEPLYFRRDERRAYSLSHGGLNGGPDRASPFQLRKPRTPASRDWRVHRFGLQI